MSDFDKYTLALLREKNQKYKICSGNRNLENNAVNKLVNSNYMWNDITKSQENAAVWHGMHRRLITEYSTSRWLLSNHTYSSVSYPHPTVTNEKLSSVGVFTNKRKLGTLWSVSLMQSCLLALKCSPFFARAPRKLQTTYQIPKPILWPAPVWSLPEIFCRPLTVLTRCAYAS